MKPSKLSKIYDDIDSWSEEKKSQFNKRLEVLKRRGISVDKALIEAYNDVKDMTLFQDGPYKSEC